MLLAGTKVQIVAEDYFYAYCDGWHGIVTGLNGGAVEVKCQRPDGEKVLYVPSAQLKPIK